MTHRNIYRFTILALIALAALAASWSGGDASSKSRKADKLIKRHVRALGGTDRLRSLNTVRVDGHMAAQGFEVPFTLWLKRPNMSRMEVDVQGRRVIQAYDGELAWWVNPFAGVNEPQEMPEVFFKSMRRWTDFDGPLVDYKKKGHEVEYEGKETLDTGEDTYKIKLTLVGGDVWFVYLDTETYLEVQRIYTQTFRGRTDDVTTQFSDFVDVSGVTTPRVVKGVGVDWTPYTMYFNEFETNIEIDDGRFRM